MQTREKAITSVTVWGAVANLTLSLFKMAAGFYGKSSAMIADSVHSLSDLVSDVIVLVMVRVASRDRDKGHDYGHGKYETLATLAVSILLLVVGARLMSGAIGRIVFVIKGGTLETPGRIALWAAVASIVVKELLFQWTSHIGRKYDSPAVTANAWHHRSDAFSSIGSALGIGGAVLLGGKWTILDPITCSVISVIIIVVAVRMAMPAVAELTEASLPDETEDRILEIIRSAEGVEGAHELKTRRNGRVIIIDVHIVVNPELRVIEAHHISSKVENALKSEFGSQTQVSVHIEPDENSD